MGTEPLGPEGPQPAFLATDVPAIDARSSGHFEGFPADSAFRRQSDPIQQRFEGGLEGCLGCLEGSFLG